MFKNILNKTAGGFVGFFEGLILGSFAGVGKWFAMLQEEEIGHEQHKNAGVSPSTGLLGIPFAVAGGLIYGPFRGMILGINEGMHKNMFKNIAKEMFTYDPFYTEIYTNEVIDQLKNGNANFVSYRTFTNAGLINTNINVNCEAAEPTIQTKNEPRKKVLSFHFEPKTNVEPVNYVTEQKTLSINRLK